MADPADRFKTEGWTAGVIGLGYVGLPFAVNAVERGVKVVGYDVNPAKVAALSGGSSSVDDVTDAVLARALAGGFRATADAADIKGLDAYFICVPSPLGRSREPDLSYIRAAIDVIADVIEPGALVSLESTTYPGTTEDIIVAALVSAGFTLDEDVFVAYSPERVSPGSTMELKDIPKVVGGVSPVSAAVARAAYQRLVETVHLVSDARVAELAKLLENTYRSVNIALANEMAQLADELGVSIWETIDAAATKPFGFHAFYPGPGVGGHCIPLDPQYLAWKAREVGGSIRFIDLAEQVNTNMPRYVVDRVARLLNDRGRALKGSTVLAIGLTYKPNVADDRESPSVEVVERLADRGANVHVVEPLLTQASVEAHGVTAVNDGAGLGAVDLAVVLTDHDGIDYAAIASAVPVVFDTRAAFRRRGISADNVVEI